jgi:ribosome-associated protein
MFHLRYGDVQDLRKEVSLKQQERTIETKKLAQRIALLCKEKKAVKVTILDLQKVGGFCSYFVIAGVNSLRQGNALFSSIQDDLDKDGIKALFQGGANDESGWLVLDYVSVIVHIFYKPVREFYSLEKLWADAKKIRIPAKLS